MKRAIPTFYDALPYFSFEEFDDGGPAMLEEFLLMLSNARVLAGIPFPINSGSRSKEHNLRVGGKPDSTHLQGIACDISAESSRSRFLIIRSLLLVGFTRIGVGKDFIHVDLGDIESDNDPEVIWLY